ncbi:hypothetical protein BGW80DRAFT_1304207, partial [Lactifluus volemus]
MQRVLKSSPSTRRDGFFYSVWTTHNGWNSSSRLLLFGPCVYLTIRRIHPSCQRYEGSVGDRPRRCYPHWRSFDYYGIRHWHLSTTTGHSSSHVNVLITLWLSANSESRCGRKLNVVYNPFHS